MAETEGGAPNIVLECSATRGPPRTSFAPLCPGGVVVYVGIPLEPIRYEVAAARSRRRASSTVLRYAHVFTRCVAMLASGSIDVAPLITRTPFPSPTASRPSISPPPHRAGVVKVQIAMPD